MEELAMLRTVRSRWFIAVIAALVSAVVVGGIAWAVSTPPQNPVDANGNIHACYNPKSGAMKLQTVSACSSKQTPIAWTQQPTTYSTVNDAPLNSNTNTAASIAVPAGNYYVRALFQTSGLNGGGTVFCTGPHLPIVKLLVPGTASQFELIGVNRFTAPDTISVACSGTIEGSLHTILSATAGNVIGN
jgi:hypothetical protein